MSAAYHCPICNRPHRDEPWSTLAGADPGPEMLAIGRARHSMTGLDALGRLMPDDEGRLRCVTCLRVATGTSPALADGDEPLCCKGARGPRRYEATGFGEGLDGPPSLWTGLLFVDPDSWGEEP